MGTNLVSHVIYFLDKNGEKVVDLVKKKCVAGRLKILVKTDDVIYERCLWVYG